MGKKVYVGNLSYETSADALRTLFAEFGEIESVTTFSELFIPVTGEVVEVNEALGDTPELVNSSPYGDGWMIRIKLSNTGELDKLLNAMEYDDFIESQSKE